MTDPTDAEESIGVRELRQRPSRRASTARLPAGLGNATFASSALLAVEARRGTLRGAPKSLPRVDLMLDRVTQVDISGAVIEAASRLPDPMPRSLDAIRLATVLLINEDIDTLVSYDDRLLAAAAAHRVPTASPS